MKSPVQSVLSAEQVAEIKAIAEKRDYTLMYTRAAEMTGSKWAAYASQIYSGVGPNAVFAREYLRAYLGDAYTEKLRRNLSDEIARRFLKRIEGSVDGLRIGAMPSDKDLVKMEVVDVIEGFGLAKEAWPGTVMAKEMFDYDAGRNVVNKEKVSKAAERAALAAFNPNNDWSLYDRGADGRIYGPNGELVGYPVHEDSFKAALGILAAKGGSYWFDRDALKSDLRILKDRFFISAGDALDKLKGTIRDAIPDPRLRKNGERDEESSLKMPDVPGGEPKTSPFGRDAIGNADSRRKVSFAGAGEPVASNDRHENPQKQPRAKAAFDEFPRLAPVPKPLEIPHDASPTRREEDMASLRQLDDSMMTGPVKFVDPMLYEWRSRNDGPVAVVAEEERDQLEAEAKGLIAANDYYDDLHKQRRVAAIFKQLYPGQLRTAPLDFGEGV